MNKILLSQILVLSILTSACTSSSSEKVVSIASPSATIEYNTPTIKETETTAPTASITPAVINKKPEIHNLALNENNVYKIKNLATFGTPYEPCYPTSDFDSALETRIVNGQIEYLLASTGLEEGKNIQVWDLEKETKIQTLNNVLAHSILFHPDQRTLISYFEHDLTKLTLWDIQNGNQRQQFIFDSQYLNGAGYIYGNRISISPDGLNVALFVGHYKGMYEEDYFRIKEFNLQTNQTSDTDYDFPLYDTLPPYIYSPKGNLVSVTYGAYGYDGKLHFLDLTNHKDTILQLPFPNFDEAFSSGAVISTISVNSSEKYVAGGARNGDIYIWDIADGTLLKSFKAHIIDIGGSWLDGVKSLEFSPESNLLISVGYDNFTKLWNANTGVLLKEINTCHHFGGFTQDGRYLVTVGEKGTGVWGIP